MQKKFISASEQTVVACKCIAPIGIKVISVIVQNVFGCKYITPNKYRACIGGCTVRILQVKTGYKLNRPHRLQI